MTTCRTAVAVVAAMAGMSACTTSQPTPSPPTPVLSTPPVSTVPESSAAHPAVRAYEGMWRDVAAAATTSDWRSPRLDDHATGDALAVVTSVLRKDHDRGLVARGEPVLSPTLESESPSSNPTSAIVQDCGDSTDWLRYRADTGELADTPGGRRAITAEVVLSDDGTWKVARFAVREIGTC